MRSIENFVDGVLEKTARKRKKKRLLNTVVSLSLCGIFAFLVGYSNIIPFGNIFQSRAYERYMQSYSTSDGKTRLKILDGNNAVLTVEDRAYTCLLSEKNAQTFSLQPLSAPTDEDLTVRFSNGKAELTGEWEETPVGVTLNIVQDMQVQGGAWVSFFVEQNEGGTFGPSLDWFLIDEKQSYCCTNTAVLSCRFVAVGDIVLQYVKDQVSKVSTALLFQTVDSERFGVPVISTTAYLNDDGSEYITSYYKQLDPSEKIEFDGGRFETSAIDYEFYSEPFAPEDYTQLKMLEGDAPWRIAPLGSISKTRNEDIKLSLDLKKNGTLSFRSSGNLLFNMSCGGKWYAFDSFVFVVLDKEYPHLGLRAFTLGVDGELYAGEFSDAAVSKIRSEGIYKVGYHTFDYYFSSARATVYWGKGWTDERFIPKLHYDTKYTFKGWYTDWHEQGTESERIYIEEDEPTVLIFQENSSCKWYKGDKHWSNMDYSLRAYDTGKFSVEVTKFYIYSGENRYSVSRLNIGVNRLFMSTTYNTTKDGKEIVREVMIEFVIAEE